MEEEEGVGSGRQEHRKGRPPGSAGPRCQSIRTQNIKSVICTAGFLRVLKPVVLKLVGYNFASVCGKAQPATTQDDRLPSLPHTL